MNHPLAGSAPVGARPSPILAVGLALVLLVVALAAAPIGVEAAPRLARGEGTIVADEGTIAFRFQVEQARGEVTGEMRVKHPTLGVLKGTVKCASFGDTFATIAGTLREPVGGPSHFQIVAQDNGTAGDPRSDVFRLTTGDERLGCRDAFGFNRPVVTGEIKVR